MENLAQQTDGRAWRTVLAAISRGLRFDRRGAYVDDELGERRLWSDRELARWIAQATGARDRDVLIHLVRLVHAQLTARAA